MTAVTVAIVALVLVLNVALTLLADKNMWYVDLSPIRYVGGTSQMYTLSEECKLIISERVVPEIEKVNEQRKASGEEALKLNIIFCADRDVIESEYKTRYVSYTARQLEKEFPELVDVQYINILKNPSAVQKYKTPSATPI